MMLQMRLKEVLQLSGLSQAELARAVGLSSAAINLLLNRSLYPKLTDEETLRSNITNWLKEKGVEAEALEGCFDPADGRYRQTSWGGNPSWQGKSQTIWKYNPCYDANNH